MYFEAGKSFVRFFWFSLDWKGKNFSIVESSIF
jgi:hypothetical protein